MTSTKFFAPSGLEALWAGRPKLYQRMDQPLAEPRRRELLTADPRRFTQIRIRRFHRRDAEYAEGRIFAQSGDDDWAKELLFKRGMFLFVVVSRQTKKAISLRPLRLCGYILEEFFFLRTWRALRESSFSRFRNPTLNQKFQICLVGNLHGFKYRSFF